MRQDLREFLAVDIAPRLQATDVPTRLMLTASVAQLLESHLGPLPEWHGCWVDDILDLALVHDTDGTHVLGYVIWGKGSTSEQWVDCLHAHFKLRRDRTIVSYTLLFRDRAQPGLLYKPHRRPPVARALDWEYRFTGPALSP